MKAILCTGNQLTEIQDWYNFEDCKKNVIARMPQKSTIILDEDLFLSLKKLGITKNYDVILFDTDKVFDDATSCKNFSELSKEIKKLEQEERDIYLPNGSHIFDELLPFCHSATVLDFDKNLPKAKLAKGPKYHKAFDVISKPTFRKDCKIYEYKNKSPFITCIMDIKYQLSQEDEKRNQKNKMKDIMQRVTSHPAKKSNQNNFENGAN